MQEMGLGRAVCVMKVVGERMWAADMCGRIRTWGGDQRWQVRSWDVLP